MRGMGLPFCNLKGMITPLKEGIMPKGIYKRPTTEERFWKKVSKSKSCWNWIGPCFSFGYGQFNVLRKNVTAHRYSYLLHKGCIPTGMVVRHTCHNPKCVNPEHLVLGTQSDNINDSVKEKRHCHEESHGMAKITVSTAIKAKELLKAGNTIKSVAAALGVGFYTVADISRGKTWRNV